LDAVHAAMCKYIERDLVERTEDPKVKFTEDWQTLRYETMPPTDPMIGAMVGDFAHNVRSALDQVVYALVKANGWDGSPAHTQLPILESEKKWDSEILNRVDRRPPPTKGLSPEALQLVLDNQPFTAGKRKAQTTHIYKLLRLSNEDKHRTLHGAGVMPTVPLALTFNPPGYLEVQSIKYAPEGTRIRVGTEVAKLKLRIVRQPPEGVEVHMNQVAAFDYGFFVGDSRQPIATSEHLSGILNVANHFIEKASQLPEASL
jgi:hypothetical protein